MANQTLQNYRENFVDEHGYIRCENCGVSNSFRFELHHIVFRSEVGKQSDIHNIKNLILLCKECHNKFHNDKSLRNKLVIERNLNDLYGRNLLIKK